MQHVSIKVLATGLAHVTVSHAAIFTSVPTMRRPGTIALRMDSRHAFAKTPMASGNA